MAPARPGVKKQKSNQQVVKKDFPTHTQPTRLYPDDRISRLNAKMRAEFYLRTRKQQHPVKIQKHIHQNHEHPLEIRKET